MDDLTCANGARCDMVEVPDRTRGEAARPAPTDPAGLVFQDWEPIYNPRQYTMLRGVAVYDGPARVIAYPPRSKRRDSRLVV